jgi:hypothetical protein
MNRMDMMFLGGKGTDRHSCDSGAKNANDFAVSRWKMEGDLSPHQSGNFLTASQPCVRVTHCVDDFCDEIKLSLAFCAETVRKWHVTIHNSYECMVLTECTE